MPDTSRRRFLQTTGLGAAGLALHGCIHQRTRFGDAMPPRPNVIYIMADDLGYADLGCYGQELIQTPALDGMAAEGVRFTQCYTGSTVCAPSRSVLMTGQHTGHTRVRGNKGRVGGVPPEGRVPLEPEDFTVAELFKQAGYATGMTGKWGLGEPDSTGEPNRQGFDEWFGYLNQARAHTYYPDYIWHNQEKVHLSGNAGDRRKDYTHDMFAEFALDYIRRHQDEPFFLYVPFCIPHDALEVPSLGPYADKDWSDDAKAYAAMVSRMDQNVGDMLSLLKELGLDHNTLVFFCSDNGAARRWDGLFNSSGPLRGYKRSLHEGGIRTPMVVRWPGMIEPGRVDTESVWYFADFLPTMADLTRQEAPGRIDGISVLPTLLGAPQDTADRFLYWEFFEGGYKQAARWRNWKAIRDQAPDGPLELYNLAEDMDESHNLAGQHPEMVRKFEDYLAGARTESVNWPTT